MAATATSPTLEALVERLLRPLVRATDDALRRLDLVIEADEDVDAAPATADAAQVDVADGPPAGSLPPQRGMTGPDRSAVETVSAPAQGRARPPSTRIGARGVPVDAEHPSRQSMAADMPSGASPGDTPEPRSANPRVAWGVAVPEEAESAPAATADGPALWGGVRVAVAAQPWVVAPSPVEAWASPRNVPAAALRAVPRGAALADHLPGTSVTLDAAAVPPATVSGGDATRVGVAFAAAPSATPPDAFGNASAVPAAPAPAGSPEMTARVGAARSFASPLPAPSLAAPTGPRARARESGLRVAPSVRTEPGTVPGQADRRRSRAGAAEPARPVPAGDESHPAASEGSPATPRPLRGVANRLDRAMAPVFSRALDAGAFQDGDDDAAAGAATRISNTFNVKVALGGAAGALDPRQIEEALGDWLRASARRQGLLP